MTPDRCVVRGNHTALFSITCMLAASASAFGGVLSGQSEGYGLSADLALLLTNVSVGPSAYAAGSAPAPYNMFDLVLGVDADAPGLANVTTGVLTATAESNVDGLPGVRFARAIGTVDQLNATVVPGFPDLLDLSATTLSAHSRVSGNFGSLGASGGSVLEDLSISVLGVALDVDANAAPNMLLYDALGIRIMLNEQVFSGDGVTALGFAVNAVHITFNGALGGTLDGDITIAHAFSRLSVPSPAGTALLGLAALASVRRRR